MATRTFSTSTKEITSSSDYIASKRQYTKYKTIYNDTLSNSLTSNKKWNKNYVIKNCGESSNLVYASSHFDLLDITKGKRYANPLLSGDNVDYFNSYTGAYRHIQVGSCNNPTPITLPISYDTDDDVKAKEINKITFPNLSQSDATGNAWASGDNPTSPWPGYLLDPYSILNDSSCEVSLKTNIINNSYLDYRWFMNYWHNVTNKSLTGISYPEKVQFNLQSSDITNENSLKYAPIPPLKDIMLLTTTPLTNNICKGISGSILHSITTDGNSNEFNKLQLNYWCDKVPK